MVVQGRAFIQLFA